MMDIGRHIPPIPDPDQHPLKYRMLQLRWRLAVAAAVYPVQLAVALALAICAVPVYMVLESQATLRDQSHQINDLVGRIQTSRARVARDICRVLDRNTRITNAQLSLYQGLIVDGAKQSAVFEPLYRQVGAPPYRVRLRQARQFAARIERLRLPLPNCNGAITEISPHSLPPGPHGNP